MTLTMFTENQPFRVTEFPFDDMYISDAKFIKLAIKENNWLGILTGDYKKYLGDETLLQIDSLDGFIGLQSNKQITKSEIIEIVYNEHRQIKILRDKMCGRNEQEFYKFDQFVQSIP
jgi:hypothetical protein